MIVFILLVVTIGPAISEDIPTWDETMTTNDQLETTNDPLETTNDPMETTSDPLETTNDPLETTKDPLETTNDPMETNDDSWVANYPSTTTKNPSETCEEPTSATWLLKSTKREAMVKNLFTKVDSSISENQRVSEEEMEAALKDYYTPEELETKFKMADLDNNGHLDFTEFHKACGFETEDLEYTEHGLEHHHGALHTPAYEVQANVHNTETRTIN